MKKQKLVEWQKLSDVQSVDYDSDLNTASANTLRMQILAREVLTERQFLVYDLVLNKGLAFSKIGKKLSISEPRVSKLWHLAADKVENAWRELNGR